eukprot:802060-Amphidinium_carterae.1
MRLSWLSEPSSSSAVEHHSFYFEHHLYHKFKVIRYASECTMKPQDCSRYPFSAFSALCFTPEWGSIEVPAAMRMPKQSPQEAYRDARQGARKVTSSKTHLCGFEAAADIAVVQRASCQQFARCAVCWSRGKVVFLGLPYCRLLWKLEMHDGHPVRLSSDT